MSARDAILRAVREARPALPDVALPDVAAFARGLDTRDDLAARFAELARAGGARVVECAWSELGAAVAAETRGLARVLSRVTGVPGTIGSVADPHELHDLDAFACEATLGVAENGATWLSASVLGERAALWLATHVVVVLDRARIVATMHSAYERLEVAAEPFGVFVAGPSKTADIEQSLVVGAHGAKSLTVVLVAAGP